MTYQWLDVSAGATAYEQLRQAIEERFGPRAGFYWDRRRSPYPGLQPFQPEDAAMFFGRDQKISEVLRHLESGPVGGSVVAVMGPSGSGKASLVRAGVVPRLQRTADNWVVTPPFIAVRYASGPEVNTLFVSTSLHDLRLLLPAEERFRHFSDEARVVVSEPLIDLPGLWHERSRRRQR